MSNDQQQQKKKVKKLVFPETLKQGPGAENRKAPRYQVSRITACQIIRLPHPLAMEARLRDISTTGIGLHAPAWLDPGTFLMITVEGWLGTNRTLRAKVMHATQVDKACWLLGCLLDNPLSWQEVEDLL
jgi:hypothetical protein